MNRRNFFKLLGVTPLIPCFPKSPPETVNDMLSRHAREREKLLFYGTPGNTGFPLWDLLHKKGKLSKVKFNWHEDKGYPV